MQASSESKNCILQTDKRFESQNVINEKKTINDKKQLVDIVTGNIFCQTCFFLLLYSRHPDELRYAHMLSRNSMG